MYAEQCSTNSSCTSNHGAFTINACRKMGSITDGLSNTAFVGEVAWGTEIDAKSENQYLYGTVKANGEADCSNAGTTVEPLEPSSSGGGQDQRCDDSD